jgi:hypothetical protein
MGAATQAGADARGCSMTIITGRRNAIQTLGLGIAASAIGLVIERTQIAQAALSSALTPQGARQLNALTQRLAKAPRRRAWSSSAAPPLRCPSCSKSVFTTRNEMVGEGMPVTGEMPCAAPAMDANSSDVTLFLTWRHTRSPDTGEAI